MGTSSGGVSELQGLANRHTEGNLQTLAESINTFLVSVSEDMPRLTPDHHIFDIDEPLPAAFTLSVEETEAALIKIKTGKATGPDNIPPWILKDFAHILSSPIAAIYNSSLREGVLPTMWRTATVVPLPKKRPPTSIEKDIRPISLTPIVAKTFESLVLKWVDDAIRDHIDPHQFGCVKGAGTTDALVELMHKWYEAADRNETFVRVLLLDYKKGFDLINHEILIEKLLQMDIPRHIVRWMAAFLLDRTQMVKVGNCLSAAGSPNGGVPQGTLSGPKDFLVQINDLRTPCDIMKYVDDSTIFEICQYNNMSRIQESADIAHAWSNDNDMVINASKTKEMLICFSKNPVFNNSIPNIVIDDACIERVNHAKVLGVTISDDLTWNKHVENIISKAGKRMYMLYQLKRSGISQTDLLKVYVSVIRPVMEYACPVWHTCLPSYLSDNIESIQKRALKSIFPGHDYDTCIEMSGLVSLYNRRESICKEYFKKMNNVSHKLYHLLPAEREVPYNLRTCNILPTTLTRTNRFKNSFIPWSLSNYQ